MKCECSVWRYNYIFLINLKQNNDNLTSLYFYLNVIRGSIHYTLGFTTFKYLKSYIDSRKLCDYLNFAIFLVNYCIVSFLKNNTI